MNKQTIVDRALEMTRRLQPAHPIQASMLQKNLRRYVASQLFLSAQLGDNYPGQVLDYGCGFPMFLSLLRQGGYDAIGYEPYAEPEHAAVASSLGVTECFFTSLPKDQQFDLVTLIDVIEHLSILRPTMTDVITRMKPGGYLAISTPNGLRFGQWLAFVRRKTAHPTSIEKFLQTDNNYVNHQREFTRPELEKTVRYYGLEVVASTCVDTMPPREDLERHHEMLGQPRERSSWRTRAREALQRSLPDDWQNNLLLLARKPKVEPKS